MPFARPTLTTLKQQVSQDIAASVPGADPLLRFSNLGILGRVFANLTNLLYGYLDWIGKEAVPFTATDEFLEGWAGLKGVVRKSATQASGQVTFTGVSGTVIPNGTAIVRGDGAGYTTTGGDVTVSGGGTAVVTITASLPGSAGNANSGTVMTLGTAIAGVQASGSATTAITGGADVETDASLRSRMLTQYAAPPQGGASTDYISWALQVSGVTRAWCKPNGMGAGTVIVYTMFDNTESAFNGFPQGTNGVATNETRDSAATGDLLAVANYIFPLQPVTALVYSVAPTASPQNFTISGVASGLRSSVSAAIANVFVQQGSPGGTVPLSYIESAISAISGIGFFVITSPTTNITTAAGALPTVGTITWT